MGVWLCAQPQPGAALSAEEQEALDARLWAAADGGDAAAVVRLAGEGASADAKNERGMPAVAEAAWKGHTEVVEALLRLGCDPNAPNQQGNTALIMAASRGHGGVVGALLEHGGVELDAVDWAAQTALMWAAENGTADCAEAQAVVLGCSAMRACGPGFIDGLERELGKPVVTSTQAFLWMMLRTAGVEDRIEGYGRLLREH